MHGQPCGGLPHILLALAVLAPGPAAHSAPANDECANALALQLGQTRLGSIGTATPDGNASCNNGTAVDAWYVYTAPQDGPVVFRLEGNYATLLSLHAPGICPGSVATEIACGVFPSVLTRSFAAGESVLVRVSAYDFRQYLGDYALSATAPPANDSCANATPIADGLSDIGAVVATPDPGGPGSPDIWIRYTPAQSGTIAMRAWDGDESVTVTAHDLALNGCPGEASDRVPDTECGDGRCFAATGGREYTLRVAVQQPLDELQLHVAAAASLAGRVSDALSGAGIPSAQVEVFRRPVAGYEPVATATADANGWYALPQLAPGTFALRTSATFHYRNELWQDLPWVGTGDLASSTPLVLAPGSTASGIDFALQPLGRISGHVRDALGQPVAGAAITITTEDRGFLGLVAETDAGGFFRNDSFRLRAGSYFAIAESLPGLLPQLYLGQACDHSVYCPLGAGAAVSVGWGTTTPGIDFVLSQPGGSISGHVRKGENNQPLEAIRLVLFDAAGRPLTDTFSWTLGSPDPGYFQFRGLASGNYYLGADVFGLVPARANEFYDGATCSDPQLLNCDPRTGTPIAVAAGADTGGIQVRLDRTGRIDGTLVDDVTGLTLDTAVIEYFDSGGRLVASFGAQNSPYSHERLAAGTYFARTVSTHVDELYDDLPCPNRNCDPTTGTPIVVLGNQITPGIDYRLLPAGGISALVRDAASGQPIPGATLALHDASGRLLEEQESLAFPSWFRALPPGSYRLTARAPGYADRLYQSLPCPLGVCDPTPGTPIAVVGSAVTTGIEVLLDPIAATPMVLSPASLPNTLAGVAYSELLSASGGTPPHVFQVGVGQLPPGIVLDPDGTLAGIAQMAGQFRFAVRVDDAEGEFAVREYQLDVTCFLTISPAALPPAIADASYVASLATAGGSPAYAYALDAGALPAGLQLLAHGVIGGTPPAGAVGTTHNFTIRSTDSGACTGTRSYSLEVRANLVHADGFE